MTNYRNYSIKLTQDPDAESPREWDNLADLNFCHSRNLPKGDGAMSWEDIEALQNLKTLVWLPVYALDFHSGLSVSCDPFNCPWDSGRCGIISVSLARLRQEYGDDSLATIQKAYAVMRKEVEAFDAYLNGDVYCYEITDDQGKWIDSCAGLYTEAYALKEAKAVIDSLTNRGKTDHSGQHLMPFVQSN